MKYFLLTCCVVLVSARPEAGYHYDPPTSSPHGGNYLSCCQRLALLQRNHGSNTNHAGSYSDSTSASSLNGQIAARIVNGGPTSNGFGAGYASNGLTSGHTSNGYITGGHSSSVGTGSSTYSSGGYSSTAGGGTSSPTSGIYSTSAGGAAGGGHTTSGITGTHTSSGLLSGHTSNGLTSGHTSNGLAAGHSTSESLINGLTGVTGLSGESLSGGFSSDQSSHSGSIDSTFTGHTSANSIRGSSSSSNGFVGGSGAGASFTPNSFGAGSSRFGGNELSGSASSGSFNSAALGGGFSAGFSGGSNTALVQKHIYVHVPPHDDEEALTKAKYEALMAPKKHYKIIFIKAPTPPTFPTAQLIANAGQQEEKTLVYVLVKKPEEPSMAEIKAAQAAIQPNKPEVYFIKYKTREAQPSVGALTDGHFSGTDFSSYSIANNQAFAYNSASAVADSVSFTTEIPPGSYGAPPPSTVYGTK